MGSEHQQFCLRWHNFQNNLLTSLPQFLNDDDLTDVTLSAGGRHVRAHRIVLSASSLYFKEIFKELLPLQHPVIVLPGMNFKDLCALLTFIYSGEVNIYQDQLPGLLSMADTLHVRGLAEVQSDDRNIFELTPKKNVNNPPTKRPKLNASPIPNQGAIQTSTNEDNHFKCPVTQPEPKTMKDFNENNTNKMSNIDLLKNYYGLPFDDSTLKMMSVKTGKPQTGRLKQKKPGFGSITSSPYTPNMALNCDLFTSLAFPKPIEPYRYNDEMMEAQDLRQVREGDLNQQNSAPTECDTSPGAANSDVGPDADHHGSTSLYSELKSEMYSPESDDSGGGGLNECYRDVGSALRSLAVQSKGFATCPVCNKQLSNQYNLRVHLETHQNVQYSCNVCSHVSRSRDALRKHVSYRHPVEGKEVGKKGKEGCKKLLKGEESAVEILDQNDSNPISLAQLSVVSP